MSKLGVPYLPCSLVWTKINLDKHSHVYPTYLPKKFGHFGTKVGPWILNFNRNLITHFLSPSFYAWRKPPRDILTLTKTESRLPLGMTSNKTYHFQTTDNHHRFIKVWTSIADLPTSNLFVQTFIFEKVWLRNTLPTYDLDIWLIFTRTVNGVHLLPLFVWVVSSPAEPLLCVRSNWGNYWNYLKDFLLSLTF